MLRIEYSFWLLPAEPVRARLRDVIGELAQEFEAPAFEPHVTLYGGPSSEEEARKLAEDIAGDFAPLELEAEGLRQSEQYSKTFYIQFRKSDAVQRMSEKALETLAEPADYILDPHLSLLYKDMAEAQRQELCRRKPVPMGKYRFDAVCAIAYEAPWSDTSAREYEIIAEYGLREGFRRRKDDLR